MAVVFDDGGRRLEHAWAARLAGSACRPRVTEGFGCSDCGCPGHLLWLPPDRFADAAAWAACIRGMLTGEGLEAPKAAVWPVRKEAV